MIDQVIASGGRLDVESGDGKPNYRTLVTTAIRFNKVPEGMVLRCQSGPGWGNYTISLEPMPDWMTTALAPIVVPATLRRPHPIVASLRDDALLLLIKGAPRSRALRLTAGLITEAEARGYRTRLGQPDRFRRSADPLFVIAIDQHSIGVRLLQQDDRTPHVATARELADIERNPWKRLPKYDAAPSSRLGIELLNGTPYRQSSWSDGKLQELEDALPQILQEIELRAAAMERARVEAEEAARLREIEWEAAMTTARRLRREANRADNLAARYNAWDRTNRLRTFLDHAATAITQVNDPAERQAAEEWLEWGLAYVEKLGPLYGRLALPPDPPEDRSTLAEFLPRGFSPWGP